MESLDELRRSIKSKDLELVKQQVVLREAEYAGYAIRQRLTCAKERMNGLHSIIEELTEKKMEFEKALKLREAEIEILRESSRKERACLIALREEEVAAYQKKLDSVKWELEEERQKILPLREEIQQLIGELAKKSEENCHLRKVWEETNSQLKMERERVEMKTKELTAAAVSTAEYMKEAQVRVSHNVDAIMCVFTFLVYMYLTDAVIITAEKQDQEEEDNMQPSGDSSKTGR